MSDEPTKERLDLYDEQLRSSIRANEAFEAANLKLAEKYEADIGLREEQVEGNKVQVSAYAEGLKVTAAHNAAIIAHCARIEALHERIATAVERLGALATGSEYGGSVTLRVANASMTGAEKEFGRKKPCGECGNAGFGHYVSCSHA